MYNTFEIGAEIIFTDIDQSEIYRLEQEWKKSSGSVSFFDFVCMKNKTALVVRM